MKENEENLEALIEEALLAVITWDHTGDADRPYQAEFNGRNWEIQVNDWPEYETVYSLVLAGKAVRDLQSVPMNWLTDDPDTWGT